MLDKIKKNKYQLIELIIIFIITLAFNLFCISITMDEIWNYGFTYNIANGLIPYKDFNMVITPLFPMLGALFLSIFGKNIIVYHIFNAIICTIIFYYMKKACPRGYYIPYSIFLLFALPNYNVFSILLLYILIELEKKNTNDYIIGIVLGLTFLTKQNIGIFLCIPTLFIKNKKNIIKRIIGFIIPNIIFLIYLLYNNILYNFVDYIFLGIKEFAEKNQINNITCILVVVSSIIYLIYQYIKNKNIETIYLICFQLLVFPMMEPYHTMIAIIPTFVYFISKLKLNKKIIKYAFAIFIVFIFSINIYNEYKGEFNYPNNTNEFKYRKILYNQDQAINIVSNNIKSIDDDVYVISVYSYIFKLESKIKINNYDLLANGNMGRNGANRIIKEIENNCSNKKCTLMLDVSELENKIDKLYIYNKEIINYIINNYNEVDKINNTNIAIYKNY